MTLTPGHLPEEQRKILRQVALTYSTSVAGWERSERSRDAAIAEYRRLSPYAASDSSRYRARSTA